MTIRLHRRPWNEERGVKPLRILLAADDVETRRQVSVALRADAHEVIEVGDLVGSQILHGPPADLIISDVGTAGRSGLEVLARIRRRDWATPFILITADEDGETVDEAHRLGALAVFKKPFDVVDLRTAVMNLV